MGAGAGYNIKGTIDYDSIKINSFEVNGPFTATEKLSGGHTQDYQVIQIKCDIEDISEIDESVIMDALYDLKFDAKIGGGWTHSTFTGDISCGIYDLDVWESSDFGIDEIVMYITNKDAIEVLDKYATGDNYEERYSVVDIDNNIISDDFYGDELKYAIAYAEENNGYQVESEKIWYSYEISDSGEIDIWDEDVDYDNVSIEWTNPNYIDDDF